MSETILERSEGRVSYHDSVEEMMTRIRGCPMFLIGGPSKKKSAVNFACKD
jgi:hypothetical protein